MFENVQFLSGFYTPSVLVFKNLSNDLGKIISNYYSEIGRI